jgi:hypothetical protein
VGCARCARALDDEAAELRRLERDGSPVLPQDPACELHGRRVLRDEHVALDPVVSGATSIRASPTMSPNCHSARPRNCSTSNSGGSLKSRSRRVANRMSDRMRETRKVRMSSRSRSWPITYHEPFSGSSAYGLSVRSISSSR